MKASNVSFEVNFRHKQCNSEISTVFNEAYFLSEYSGNTSYQIRMNNMPAVYMLYCKKKKF